MAVLPEFTPAGRPGEVADNFIQGRNATESWMTMAQQRRIREDQEQRTQDEFQAKMPVLHAQAQADVATAYASVQLATRMQQLRTQAGVLAPTANNEFLDAMQLADPASQFGALGGIQAKYAWMKNLPEYTPFLGAVDKARGDALQLATANNLAEATLQRTQMLTQGRVETANISADTRKDVATIAAGARTEAAATTAESRQNVANITAGARVNAAEIGAHSRENKAGKEISDLNQREDMENAAAQEALDAGDTELAKFHLQRAAQFKDAAIKASTYANTAPSEPDKKPTPIVKTMRVPPPAGQKDAKPKDVRVINVEGKDYPIFKDKNGNRAYLKDGQYIELPKEQ